MKATGIVRKVDQLRRLVIPVELCRTNRIEDGTPMEIYTEGNMIILKKYEPECVFCGSLENVGQFKGKNVCAKCRKDLRGLSDGV